ncbi:MULTISPECIES: hypothetical protein [Mycobacteriaceae]|jgi:hypothetical protein|uniref:WXG100 family type VII secretion target n=5 Tax=Mycobacteriaceae TaxID=1762 RepID=A0A1Y0C5Z3_9MYCO|nr:MULTISPECIES: hypothetical protein [Mycobacteriaceae]ART70466.1 hypothetical protein BTO20_19535 [Mycobacterium dioxanotrophicus]KLI04166.1 hypothetical protein AA982_31545 [Mycolicibacterium senegalense]KLO50161.1 hypothetical protein ABW05_00085 [Mycolicibacterium senegalense]MBP2452003.1 hypothetical protein [Mycolicibacterium lutetiense]OHT97085.1 hypothetical protein BKG61_17475 [Mycobacterium syngnathidarum]
MTNPKVGLTQDEIAAISDAMLSELVNLRQATDNKHKVITEIAHVHFQSEGATAVLNRFETETMPKMTDLINTGNQALEGLGKYTQQQIAQAEAAKQAVYRPV